MKTITEELLIKLENASDVTSFFSAHENDFLNISTVKYLNDLLSLKKMTVSAVAKNSGVGEYLYKVFSGERNASRDILISVAFGLKLDLKETQLLLRISKFAILDSRDKRDSIIIFGLINSKTIFETDDMLCDNKFTTLVKC